VREVCFVISDLVMITRTILAYIVGAVYFLAVNWSFDYKSAWSIPRDRIQVQQYPFSFLQVKLLAEDLGPLYICHLAAVVNMKQEH
jgi:hypothetical protein